MDIIKQLKQEVARARASWERDRTVRAHGAMTAAQSRLDTARWLIRAGYDPSTGDPLAA